MKNKSGGLSAAVDPRRRLLLAAGAGIVLAPSEVLAARSVHRLEGDVWANGRSVDFHSTIRPGDLIETGENSYIVFSVDRDVFMLRANSRLQLQAKRGFLESLLLTAGGLLSAFEPGRPRIVQSPVATAGIRGTGCYMETDAESTYFCNCYGNIDLSSSASSENLVSNYHVARRVDADSGAINTDVFRAHHNAELALLESLAGRQPGLRKPG